jgi:ribose transport system permease protein
MTFVILARGIDLSVGAMLALVSMFLGKALTNGWPGIPAVLAVVAAGLGLGLLNGLLIGKVKINFFVVTLGTALVFRSGSLLITEGNTITLFGIAAFDVAGWLGDANVGSVPVPALVAAVVFLASYAVLRWTVFGRAVYAVGGNPEAARLAGIPVARVTVAVYAISGLLVGLAAVMYTGRIQSATPQVGTGLELQVIAAVLLGGVSFTGGSGSIVGALVGALLIAVINNGLDLLEVSSFWQGVVTGAILIFAVFLDRFRRAHA